MTSVNTPADISIVICTYDPDQRVLARCLESVAKLSTNGLNAQCILVDNNSPQSIAEYDPVKKFLSRCPWASLIREERQGLTWARIAGFRNATAPLIVYFDDDNEPDHDYLLAAVEFANENPEIGAFGPGRVRVDFLDGAEEWLYEHKGYFQESDIDRELIGRSTDGYAPCNPYGTGLVLRREVMQLYQELVEAGSIRTSDRKGKSLSSAGDLQIVWLALREGFAAGKTPRLRLTHMITGGKANRGYIRRFLFSGGKSYLPARLEIFPAEREAARNAMMSTVKANALCLKLLITNAFNRDLDLVMAGQIGSIEGYCEIFGKQPSRFVGFLRRKFGFDI